jgi:DNA-binding PadR family transcriptional regulator
MPVRHALLGLLAQRPRHGYELHLAFTAVAGGEENWALKPAQVYTTLSRLEEAGLVTCRGVEQGGGPEKRIYALTPAGHAELAAWLTAPVLPEHRRDEFFLKVMVALATGEAQPQRIIYQQRGALYQELHNLTEDRAGCDPRSELAHILLLDQAVMHVEADLRWLDMVEARLDEISRQPLPEPEPRPRGRPKKQGLLQNTDPPPGGVPR